MNSLTAPPTGFLDHSRIARRASRPRRASRASSLVAAAIETLEARRLLAAEIIVRGNGVIIANDDITPSVADHTDFGTFDQGDPSPTRTYTVTNQGDQTLEMLPPGTSTPYTVIEPLDDTLAPGESDSFTVSLSTADEGIFYGEVVIASNDPDTPLYSFAVTATVGEDEPEPEPQAVKINFQPAGRPVPAGYLADVGSVASHVDGLLMVVRAGVTQRPVLEQALALFEE